MRARLSAPIRDLALIVSRSRSGHYQIIAKLGEQAEWARFIAPATPRLGCEVALTILPSDRARNPANYYTSASTTFCD
jgi:hypothetical protein